MTIPRPSRFIPLVLALLALLSGCADPVGSYQSNAISDHVIIAGCTKRSLDYEGPLRNPVILIHGLLGARLIETDSGREVWGSFSATPPSASDIARLAHPMKLKHPLRELTNNTSAGALLDTAIIRVMGFPFSVSGYDSLVELLRASGYVLEGQPIPPGKNFPSLFIFYYDWRRDVVENARALALFVEQKKKLLQNDYERLYGKKEHPVKFDLVAHSMGGLVSRYYARYGNQDLPDDPEKLPELNWSGAKNIGKLIQVGTPNAGYLDTILEMTNGLQLATAAPVYPPALIGTFPSYYEMLPYPHRNTVFLRDTKQPVDIFDPNVWIEHNWGLANDQNDEMLKVLLPDVPSPAERRIIALDHLKKCLVRAKQLALSMSVPDPGQGTPPFRKVLFLGDAISTSSTASVDPVTGVIAVETFDSGDGKVACDSARFELRDPNSAQWSPFLRSPIRWDNIFHVRGAHMGITKSGDFAHNLRYMLVQIPPLGTEPEAP